MKVFSLSTAISLSAVGMALIAPAYGQADIYECVSSTGTREYSNMGSTQGCKKVTIYGIPKAASTESKPAAQAVPASSPAAAARPTDFPKIDTAVQKARDTERMQILTDEIKAEEKKLATLKAEFNNGEPERQGNERNYAKYQARVESMKAELSRSEKNIEALKREISKFN